MFEELGRVAGLLLDVEQRLQPGMGALLQVGHVRVARLVQPVRRHAAFGGAVHLLRADLEFDRGAVGADQGGVQRLVAVDLADRDVVLELAGHRLVQGVQRAERHVTVGDAVDHDAKAVHVQHLRERQVLVAHLFIDAVQRLFAAIDFELQAAGRELVLDRLEDLLDHFAAVAARGLDRLRQGLVAQRIQVREREVLQLAVDIVQAEAVGNRHIHFHRLAGDAALLGRHHDAQRAHIVQAVGELDQDHAHVGRHRQQHLAEILGLRFELALELDLLELGQAVDEVGDLGAEALDQFVFLDVLVFDHVVQQGGHDGLRIELPLGANLGDGDRMGDIGLARLADLAQVHLVGEAVGFLDFLEFGRREVFGQHRDELRDRCDAGSDGLEVIGRTIVGAPLAWSNGVA